MDIDKMLRTYLHLNDPKFEGITYKFAGAFLVLALALGVSYWAGSYYDTAPDAPLASEGTDQGPGSDGQDEAAGATFTTYVGLDAETFDPRTYDPAQPEAMLDAWKAQHPDVEVISQQEVKAPGQPDLVIGYDVTYR